MTPQDFQNQFSATLDHFSSEELSQAWSSPDTRTWFYAEKFFPTFAKKADMTHALEQLHVDHLIFTRVTETRPTPAPVVWIESENAVTTAEREIWKLCCLNGPLKVLLTVMAVDCGIAWSGPGAAPGFPPGWQTPKDCFERWGRQVKSFVDQGMDVGSLWVVVGELAPEWDPKAGLLRFYAADISPQSEPKLDMPFWSRSLA